MGRTCQQNAWSLINWVTCPAHCRLHLDKAGWLISHLVEIKSRAQGKLLPKTKEMALSLFPVASLSLLNGANRIGGRSRVSSKLPSRSLSLLHTSFLSQPSASLSFPSSFSGMHSVLCRLLCDLLLILRRPIWLFH